MEKKFDFIVVGGGIVGTATAYKLQLKFPKKSIAIIEKEEELGKHQTGRNSGVIHSGIYYKPGSLKAINCNNGRHQLVDFAEKNSIEYDICGKIIVATKESDISALENIFQNGIKNGTEGITFLNSEEIAKKEPFIKGEKAIWVPTAGIIDYVAVSKKFIELMVKVNSNSELFLENEVLHISRIKDQVLVKTDQHEFSAEKMIICAGLHSDRIAKTDDLSLKLQIVGFRGDYYKFKEEAKHKIKNLVYPVPDPKYPFLGVHFTPMVNGDIECGPNAVFSFKREGYSKTDFSFKDTLQALSFIGTWKLFAKNWQKGMDEYKRAFSKRLFVKELQKLMPAISDKDVVFSRSGVRAQAVDKNGDMVDDFKIVKKGDITHVINAPSPAATACMSIADEIISKAFELELSKDITLDQGDCCYYKPE